MSKRYLLVAAAALPAMASALPVPYISPTHVFSQADVTAGFDGTLAGDDSTVICGDDDVCPTDAEQPLVDKSGTTLYPVDSEFGYIVSDFVGAAQKSRDGDYGEGFVGNHTDGDGSGLMVANAPTVEFRAGPNRGTWCSGMGGTSVKCSSEHFVVMEHVLTCHETVPYAYADPATGDQADLIDPETQTVIGTCGDGDALLDTTLNVVENNLPGDTLLTSMDQLAPNESTVREDIALGDDYSITKKDDGKPLYRWGDMVKRPNDIRLYASLPLPAAWKQKDLGGNYTAYTVLDAKLHVRHMITNNPNDQIRPEDMENEAATGILPEYAEVSGNWQSSKDCYEGDGDYIPAGTILRNSGFTDVSAFSADLQDGLTNAWYTSLDRDPFDGVLDSAESGPRWRLKSNKFGQDIPSLEIPTDECTQPPFIGGTERYEVGTVVTTTIDLLDWEGISPLKTSIGWVDQTQNDINLEQEGNPAISVNGTPLTEDFDLAIYIKGDSKSTVIYDAWLEITWDDGITVPLP
ncbi:hypothetical protein MWU49_08855 [Alcanivorax sp. S6407]|uniref:hypothetical protein n=1 Tax=Alcanivorax sp. S6407 TaxID=2926424 RepID=UPI001FF3CF87|nr:hypothetical protein [Alcanivorax sp. S6407]MCK0153810.1 hypothetical protein [Alcanivorax sp. S6407]